MQDTSSRATGCRDHAAIRNPPRENEGILVQVKLTIGSELGLVEGLWREMPVPGGRKERAPPQPIGVSYGNKETLLLLSASSNKVDRMVLIFVADPQALCSMHQ